MSKSREYTGHAITVSFDPGRCIHAAECVKGLPKVFDPDRRPWVEPNADSANEIAAVIRKCPTGALHYSVTEPDQAEGAPPTNRVQVTGDGPLYVNANIKVVDSAGKVLVTDTRMALCRCGASENKPFCDGRHRDAGFEDPGLVSQDLDKAHDDPTGDLEIRAVANGPLLCAGRFELVDGKGESIATRESGALCRCGHSKNKPFCDGTHNQVGFKAD